VTWRRFFIGAKLLQAKHDPARTMIEFEDRPRRRKRLGQVFLHSLQAMHRIVENLDLSGDEAVLEVGAGDGRLSRLIAPRVRRLLANELDERFVEVLRKALAPHANAVVLPGDILSPGVLEKALEDEPAGRFVVYGSIPYYITSPILRWTLDHSAAIERAAFLVQSEVADRVTAKPGSKAYGFLSVIMQRRSILSLGPLIGRKAFRPVPRVDSRLLHIRPSETADREKEEAVERLAAALFRHRRKQIGTSLRTYLKGGLPAGLQERLLAEGFSLTSRPEELTPRQFETLYLSIGSDP
jgi:16S rRNA (adenine1518-N6/adenine1519-N6)-dimethyltransferase